MPYLIPPQALQKKTATVNKSTTKSTTASKRIDLLPSARTVETVAKAGAIATGVVVTAVTAELGPVAPVLGYAVGKTLYSNFDKIYTPQENPQAETRYRKSPNPPAKFQYNLPPHQWSIPVRTIDAQGGYIPDKDGSTKMSGETTVYSRQSSAGGDEVHRVRRGVIWNWDTGDQVSVIDEKGAVKTAAQLLEAKSVGSNNKVSVKDVGRNNYSYGFQFLWNPESISMSVERNMDVTPSPADKFRTVIGAFPGMQNYSMTIMLDRVNDFACLKSIAGPRKSVDAAGRSRSSGPSFASAHQYYKYSLYDKSPEELNQQLYELSRLGTNADLEYLFKAINGDGPNNKGGWQTLLKKKSADIGFLSPTLMAFRLGPHSDESISFVGWISSLSVNHIYFTEEMVPLRTQVSLQCQAFAGSSLA